METEKGHGQEQETDAAEKTKEQHKNPPPPEEEPGANELPDTGEDPAED